MNYVEIYNKFNRFYNVINIIKIVNKMEFFST